MVVVHRVLVNQEPAPFQYQDPLSSEQGIQHHSDMRQHYVAGMEEGDHGELSIQLEQVQVKVSRVHLIS